ncbi:DUF4230 domain-containing protein [Indiicoccus explosivorum]|uniref:DUF4230 domain-containing protein n=1 Tax=Indiicoccus explosivorum TaxID=1917864 RepID=UPI001F4E9369|nr:DUF4230 domain-containing protein [Indiicoccus explosivorum]
MPDDRHYEELERKLNELQQTKGRKRKKDGRRAGFRGWIVAVSMLVILLAAAMPFAVFWYLQQGSTFQESKGVFLERIQELNELSTAEAYTKVIIERSDNELFGRDIGFNLPGTERQLLVVVPGKVRAGIDFSEVTEEDIRVDEEAQTAVLILPQPVLLGEPELQMDQVEVYSHEGLFRDEADVAEAFDLAEEAQAMMKEEATAQGVLELAQDNAERSVQEMFSLVGYDVTIQFE